MASFQFDSTTVEPTGTFDVLPAGTYPAVALSSEMRVTKAGGEMASFKMQITDGQHSGRVLFARFNVVNASAKAQEIGRGQLSAFCRAAGVEQLTDTDDLVGKPVMIKVKVRPEQNGYPAQNEIDGFAAQSAAGVAHATHQPTSAPAPRPAAPGVSKPWQKAA